MTINDWLKQNTAKLKNSGVDSARLDCLLLVEDELEKSREWVLSHNETELTLEQSDKLNKNVQQRAEHQPLAYIVSSKEFYGRNFFVTPDVLIPRPESEYIIDLLKKILNQVQDDTSILDVGTGSGCLAITAKLELPSVNVIATDISDSALRVAGQNAKNLKADVAFIKSDLLSSIPDLQSSIFLANLPYVPDGLITSEEITKEPALALYSGKDGLNHYTNFWSQVSNLEHKPKHIITESLENQHEQMKVLAKTVGYNLSQTETLIQLFSL